MIPMNDKKEITLKDVWEKLDQNKTILRDIARWLRFQNIGKLKEVLETELDTDEKKMAFENTDGENGLKEVSSISGAPQDTVYSWWKKWFNLGIVEPSETHKGRLRKICSLEDVGIKIPKSVRKKDQGLPQEVNPSESKETTGGVINSE